MALINSSLPWLYCRTIRPLLPKHGYVELNGVKIQRKKLFDDKMSNKWHWNKSDNPNYEEGIVNIHHKITNKGDNIIIIGGGYGVSMIKAAELVSPSGTVTVYEGSKKQIKYLQNLIKRYNMESVCEIKPAIVGDNVKLYGEETTSERVPSSKIKDCDVLELDCEGAEFTILPRLTSRPKHIIVEVHPHLVEEDSENLLNKLYEMGYEFKYFRGHDGNNLSEVEFKNIINHDRTQGRITEFGAAHPPIICAEYSN